MFNIKKRSGFTIIELAMVIGVLGILVGIAIPRIYNANAAAKGSKIVADLRTIDSSITRYATINGTYPTSQQLVPNYLAKWPEAPTGNFRIATNNGRDVDYNNSSNAGYIIFDGRATLLGNEKTVDYYLAGGDMKKDPVSIGIGLNKILSDPWVIDYFAHKPNTASLDSEAVTTAGVSENINKVNELLAALGYDASEVSWKIRKNRDGSKIEIFVSRKLTTADVGKRVAVTKYDSAGNAIETQDRLVVENNIDGTKYPTISV